MIEQEFNGMSVDQNSQYYEYDNGYRGEQPYVENNCSDYYGYCHNGNCNGSCC